MHFKCSIFLLFLILFYFCQETFFLILAALFGFVQQTCPKAPLAEIWEIKECITDADCSPRICCPETLKSGENISYCRTPEPVWDNIPAPKQLVARKYKNIFSLYSSRIFSFLIAFTKLIYFRIKYVWFFVAQVFCLDVGGTLMTNSLVGRFVVLIFLVVCGSPVSFIF